MEQSSTDRLLVKILGELRDLRAEMTRRAGEPEHQKPTRLAAHLVTSKGEKA